jgi:large conductance mechanosensitive channel
MLQEFKKFAMKGNVVDMAVGIIIGAAFSKIVKSFVADILMPPLGKILGGVDFTGLFYALDGKVYESLSLAKDSGAPILAYGNFIQTVVDFLIVAFSIFIAIKAMNSLKKKEEEAPAKPAEPSAEVKLLTEIRDSLKD